MFIRSNLKQLIPGLKLLWIAAGTLETLDPADPVLGATNPPVHYARVVPS